MIYKDFKGDKLSLLGFGMMRLPIGKNDSDVNEEVAGAMIDYAISHGVNYFDTAWDYHAGNSEIVAGKYLKKYPRSSYYLATKFPGYDTSKFGYVEEIFEKQLEKCETDYFDFYLLHNVYEKNTEMYLNDKKFATVPYLLKQKASGRIRHLGFSSHGSYENLKYFLEHGGSDLDFCQIQLNYLDWHFQEAKSKVELLNSYNIPIWVMEPLRGGRLATLCEDNARVLKELRPDERVSAWAFRFLQAVEGVTMILSGMSNMEQMKQNISVFDSDLPLNKSEFDTIVEIADNTVKQGVLPCTACRYCTTHCPMELDIPRLLSLYNEHTFTGGGFIAPMAISALPDDKRPKSCVGCRSCEAVCPQQIKISEALAKFSQMVDGAGF